MLIHGYHPPKSTRVLLVLSIFLMYVRPPESSKISDTPLKNIRPVLAHLQHRLFRSPFNRDTLPQAEISLSPGSYSPSITSPIEKDSSAIYKDADKMFKGAGETPKDVDTMRKDSDNTHTIDRKLQVSGIWDGDKNMSANRFSV
jgi:hypothetical protein